MEVTKQTSCEIAARRNKCREGDVAHRRQIPLPGEEVEYIVYVFVTQDKTYVTVRRIHVSLQHVQHLQLSREVD